MSYDEKAVVKIDAEGGVVKCAKGATGSDCGYKPGAKVCGKCGAMAVEVKMVPVDAMDEDMEEDVMDDEEMTPEEQKMLMRRRKAMQMGMDDMAEEEDVMEDDEEMTPEEQKMAMDYEKMMLKRKGMGKYTEDEEVLEVPEEDEMMDEEDVTPTEKTYGMNRLRKGMPGGSAMDEDMAEEEVAMDDEEMTPEEQKMAMAYEKMMRMRKGMGGYVEDEEEMLSPAKGMGMTKPGMKYKNPMAKPGMAGMLSDEEDDMDMEDDMDIEERLPLDDSEMPMPMPKKKNYMGAEPGAVSPDMEAMRMARLRKLGTKSADIGANGYLCAIERKVYPGATSVCDDCPGGCVAEKGMPGLLHVEGLAEQMFKGDVIDSGYSQEADMFVVDVQVKSGHVNEVFVDGTTGEVLGFHRLDDSVFEQKSLISDIEIIDFNEAADIAVKSIPGTVVAVEPAIFEGFDSYQVEIDGLDGKSYDAFVSLDGEVLGYDQWDDDDTAEIEAEAAEIALKRAFSDEARQDMAKEGTAMEDGSFPIASEEDLRNAIMAHGRAKDVEAAKRHIMKQAKAMGKEDMIPAEWVAGEKSLSVEDDSNGTNEFLKTLVEFELMSAEVSDNEL
jgi:uncharacterized membrane protein YkoI